MFRCYSQLDVANHWHQSLVVLIGIYEKGRVHMVTFLLSLLAILGISLMLFSAVALVQDKRLMGSAPKEAQELVQAKPERFKGQHIL